MLLDMTAAMTTCDIEDCKAPKQDKQYCKDHLRAAKKAAKKEANDKSYAELKRGRQILRVLEKSEKGRAILKEIDTGRWLESPISEHESDDSDDDLKEESTTVAKKNKDLQIADLTAKLQELKVIVRDAATAVERL